MAIDEAAYGPDHPDVATDLNNLALSCGTWGTRPRPGRCPNAPWSSTKPPMDPTTPPRHRRLNVLALILQALGDPTAARPLLERALAIAEAAYGPDHPTVAVVRGDLTGLFARRMPGGTAEPTGQLLQASCTWTVRPEIVHD